MVTDDSLISRYCDQKSSVGALWPVLNKHLCCQQPIYVTVHATEEGRRYSAPQQLPAVLPKVVPVPHCPQFVPLLPSWQLPACTPVHNQCRCPNCPMQTHQQAITHGSSCAAKQNILKLFRIQEIFEFMLKARRRAALRLLQICIWSTYGALCSVCIGGSAVFMCQFTASLN